MSLLWVKPFSCHFVIYCRAKPSLVYFMQHKKTKTMECGTIIELSHTLSKEAALYSGGYIWTPLELFQQFWSHCLFVLNYYY